MLNFIHYSMSDHTFHVRVHCAVCELPAESAPSPKTWRKKKNVNHKRAAFIAPKQEKIALRQ
jgi:hypothetical protein